MAVHKKIIYFAINLSAFTVCYGLDLSDNCRKFSLEVINHINVSRSGLNIVLAPFPLCNLLFDVALAASGDSAKQVWDALKLTQENNEMELVKANKDLKKRVLESDDAAVHLTSDTYMFWDDDFQVNAEFKAIINYALEIKNQILDFSDSTAAAMMADSFMANTKFKFENLLSYTEYDKFRMLLTSLTSFEGPWTLPFDVLDTTIETFYSEKGEVIRSVYMMNQRNKFPITYIRELAAFVLQMSYGTTEKYCMLILLPSPGNTIGEVCQKLIENFTLENVFHKLNNETQKYDLDEISIKIPRFEIRTNWKLERFLNLVGVRDIFASELANFSRATGETIYVSPIQGNVHIRVTESGASVSDSITAGFTDRFNGRPAASSTSSYRPKKTYPVYPPGFIANRPFIYYVMEKKTMTIVYGGAVSESTVF